MIIIDIKFLELLFKIIYGDDGYYGITLRILLVYIIDCDF
jgi:hypothetical protein